MPWRKIHRPTGEEASAFEREFRKKTRFLVDENMPDELADALRGRKWNVKTVAEVGLQRRSDEDVVAFAHRDDRVLLTFD